MPLPERATVCGLPLALSAIERLAGSPLVVLGVKVTEMVQLAPAASVVEPDGQVVVCAKSAAFVPPTLMLEIESAEVPLFVSVTVWAALVEPRFWLPKARLVGERLTPGAAVPL